MHPSFFKQTKDYKSSITLFFEEYSSLQKLKSKNDPQTIDKISKLIKENRPIIALFFQQYDSLQNLRSQDDPEAIHKISGLIGDYQTLIKVYFEELDVTDSLYCKIRRIYHILSPEEAVEHSANTKKYYQSFDEQISIYSDFINKLNALEQSDVTKRSKLQLELTLYILKYHPVLYHLSYVVFEELEKKGINRKDIHQVSNALDEFTKNLDDECFLDDSDNNFRISLDAQHKIAECFFLLSHECLEKYIDILKKVLKDQSVYFEKFPVLPAQLAMVNEKFVMPIHFSHNSYYFSMCHFQLAISLRTELFPAGINLSLHEAPTLSSTYIYALLTCCDALNPCGALLTAIDLLRLAYNKSIAVNLQLADLLAENLKMTIGKLTKSFPGLSSLVYCLFLFSCAQIEYLRQSLDHKNANKTALFKKIVAQPVKKEEGDEEVIEVVSSNEKPGFNDTSKVIFQNALKEFQHFRECFFEEQLDDELAGTGLTFQQLLSYLTTIQRVSELANYILPVLAKSDALQRDIHSLQLEPAPFGARRPALVKSLSN